MGKVVTVSLAVLAIVFCGVIIPLGVSAQEDGIVIESNFGNATFNHSSHGDFSCEECHHMGETDQACTDCHNEEADINSKQAFHENCITCHQDREEGPTGCTECHEK